MCYFPITFLSAYYIYHVLFKEAKWKKYLPLPAGIIGALISFALIALPVIGKKTDIIIPYLQDEFARGNLQADVHWSGSEIIAGVIYGIAVIATIVLFTKRRLLKGYALLFFSTAITVLITLKMIAPKIESYTQGAPIEFYKSLQGKDVYVEVLEFKSYAHLFYTKKLPTSSLAGDKQVRTDWLLYGNIDKPAYFVVKNINADSYREMPQLKIIKEENGFVFFVRDI